jgi:hypothetical protein
VGGGCRRAIKNGLDGIHFRRRIELTKGFLLGVLAVVVLGGLAAYIGITQGLLIPANADAVPGKMERWAARASLHATIAREASNDPNPLPTTMPNLLAGIKLYGENCSVCHGVADGNPSTIAAGLYQHSPQLGKDGVEDDPDGVTYWKIYHGIRLTGMPSFGHSLSENQLWQLTMFLKHMDKLPPKADDAWHALKNPVPPAPAKEHQEKGRGE